MERAIAYKLPIEYLYRGTFVKSPGDMQPSYVHLFDLQVSRVNIIGTVTEILGTETLSGFILDDGTGQIHARAFDDKRYLLEPVSVGSLVCVIGRMREYNDTLYVQVEVVKTLDTLLWLQLRKKEQESLLKIYNPDNKKLPESSSVVSVRSIPEGASSQSVVVSEELVSDVIEDVSGDDLSAELLRFIDAYDSGTGVTYELIAEKKGIDIQVVEEAVFDLIKGGDVFEVSPGRLKLT